MDDRITRFKYCDSRLYPYLDRVFARLPEVVREDVLANPAFQLLADAELPEICGRGFVFDEPVDAVIYFNPRALIQPDYRLIYNIAHEIAGYVAGKAGKEPVDDAKKEKLLIEWGFEREADAVHYCEAIAKSEGFRVGYEWARKQNKDYLLLHFGLYFDEWNEKGLARMSTEKLKELRTHAAPDRILPGAGEKASKGSAGSEQAEGSEKFSLEETLIEGIMAALKEIKMKN